MRNMKKILAMVFVSAIILTAISPIAFAVQDIDTASGTTGTVTITNATVGENYQGYRIFNATVARNDNNTPSNFSDDSSSAISYTWAGSDSMPLNDYFTTDAQGHITAKEAAGTNSGNLTQAALDTIKNWIGTDNSRYGFPSTASVAAADPEMVFNGLDYGYWYFTSSLGTLVTINSTNPNVTVSDKNVVPTILKTVKEDSDDSFKKQNDADIGDDVEFKIEVHVRAGNKGLVLYDQLSPEMTLNAGSINVYNGSILTDAHKISSNTYTVNTNPDDNTYMKGGASAGNNASTSGKASFILTFSDTLTESLTENTTFTVTYTAKVNSKAAAGTPISNYATLKYGQANYTAEASTQTYVWKARIYKYTTAGTMSLPGTPLGNAKFVIYKIGTVESSDPDPSNTTSTNVVYYATVSNGKLTGWTAADSVSTTELPRKDESYFTDKSATLLTTAASGIIEVDGLDEGTYYVLEVTPPAGFNKLIEAQQMVFDSTSDSPDAGALASPITLSNATDGTITLNIHNGAGTELPSTGGIGTTIFYVIGAILVIGAGVILVARRRVNSEE